MPKYLFGPVPSRRLGMSLGVDLVPHKTCSLDCIYCECGETTCHTAERNEYVPTADVIEELDSLLSTGPALDYITFSGAGEPTLHSGFGKIVHFLKTSYPQYKVCLLTNATFLKEPDFQADLQTIDLIVPSLDASDEEEFLAINRPAVGISFQKLVHGLVDFRPKFSGQFWLELFVVPGINDRPESISRFVSIIRRIRPDKVQLNSLDRPGCVDWIRSATHEEMQPFLNALQTVVPTEVVCRFRQTGTVSPAPAQTLTEAMLAELISRRPCTIEDMATSLQMPSESIREPLDRLEAQGRLLSETRERGTFYRLKK